MTTTDTTITINGRSITLAGHTGQALPNLDNEDWRDGCDHVEDNEIDSLYGFDLADGKTLWVDCLQGYPECAHIDTSTAIEVLSDWYYNQSEDVSREEWLASWGFSTPEILGLEVADDTWDGPSLIWVQPNYFYSHLPKVYAHYLHDMSGEIAEFETYADAKARYDAYYSEPSGYVGIAQCDVLGHDQAGSDTLTIVKDLR